MEEEKMKKILEAMQGMTYLEWSKLRNVIDRTFECEASKLKNNITIADFDKINDSYKRLF